MAGRGAPTAIAPSDAQWCRHCRQRESRPTSAPAVTDKFAHSRSATWSAARRRSRPDAEIVGGEVSCALPDIRAMISFPASLWFDVFRPNDLFPFFSLVVAEL